VNSLKRQFEYKKEIKQLESKTKQQEELKNDLIAECLGFTFGISTLISLYFIWRGW
jgi:hypothetical protein